MVKFFKRTDITTNPLDCGGTLVSKIYGDMFHGKAETIDLLGNPSLNSFLIDIPAADLPTFGEAEVVGYKLGLKVNSINQGDSNTLPQIKIYKASRDIKGRTGTFIDTGATGSQNLIINSGTTDNIYAMSTYPAEDYGWSENFSSFEEEDSNNVKTWESTTTISSEPFLDAEWAEENAQYIGYDKAGSDNRKFESRYVTTNASGKDIVYVTEKTDYGSYLSKTAGGAAIGSQVPFVGTIIGGIVGLGAAVADDGGKCYVPANPQNTNWYNDLPKWDIGDAENAGSIHHSSETTLTHSEAGDMLTNDNSIFKYVETTENIVGATAEGNEKKWVESTMQIQTKVKSEGSRALKSYHQWLGGNKGGVIFEDAPQGEGHPNLAISGGDDADWINIVKTVANATTQANVQTNFAGFSGIPTPLQLGGWNSSASGVDNQKFDSMANNMSMRIRFAKMREVPRYPGGYTEEDDKWGPVLTQGPITYTNEEFIVPMESCFAVTFSEKEPKSSHTLTQFFQEECFTDPYSAGVNQNVGFHQIPGGTSHPTHGTSSAAKGNILDLDPNKHIDYSTNRINLNQQQKSVRYTTWKSKGINDTDRYGVQTGDIVFYKRDGSTDIGGLTNQTFYYAIVESNEYQIKLAATRSDALAGTAISLSDASATGEHELRIPRLNYDGSAYSEPNSVHSADAGLAKLYGYLEPSPLTLDSEEKDYKRDFNGVMFYKKEGKICISPFNHGSQAGGRRAGTVFTSCVAPLSLNYGTITASQPIYSLETENTGKCLIGSIGCRSKDRCDETHYPSGIGNYGSYWLPDDKMATTTDVAGYVDGTELLERRIVETNMSVGKWYDLNFVFPWNKDFCELHIFEAGDEEIMEVVRLWNVHSTAHGRATTNTNGTPARARLDIMARYNAGGWDGKTIVLTDNSSTPNTVTFTFDTDTQNNSRTDANNYVVGGSAWNSSSDPVYRLSAAINTAREAGECQISAEVVNARGTGANSAGYSIWLTQDHGARSTTSSTWGNTAITGTAITGLTGTFSDSSGAVPAGGTGVYIEAYGWHRAQGAFDGGVKHSSIYGDVNESHRINRDNWTPCLTIWHTNIPSAAKDLDFDADGACSDYHPLARNFKEKGVTLSSDAISEVYVDSISYRHINFKHNNNTISEENKAYDKLVIKNHEVRDLTPNTDLVRRNKYELLNHKGYISLGFENLDHLKAVDIDNNKPNYLFFNNFGSANLSMNDAVPDANLTFTHSQDEKLGVQIQTLFEGDYPLRINTDLDHGSGDLTHMGVEGFSQKGVISIESDFTGDQGSDATAITKRENLLASARILGVSNSNNDTGFDTVQVDSAEVFRCGRDTEYIVYRWGDDFIPRNVATVKYVSSGDSPEIIKLSKNIQYVDQPKLTVSNLTFSNTDTRWNFDEDGDETADGVSWLVSDYFKVGDTIKVTGFTGGYTALNTSYVITAISTSSSSSGQYFDTADVGSPPASAQDDITFQLDAPTTGNDAALIDSVEYSYLETKGKMGKLFISPKKYWFIIGYQNFIINDDDDVEVLPSSTYSGVLTTTFDDGTLPAIPDANSNNDFGCSFNEHLYSDGQYLRSWSLDVDSASILKTDVDYGFGVWDKEEQDGGYVALYTPVLNNNDTARYNEIDLSGLIADGIYESGDIVSLMISPANNETNHKINISTHEDDTASNRPYLLTIYEDKVMEDPELSVKASEEDSFYPEFNWKSTSKDAWYGMLLIDDKNIYNQYNDAILHFPLNFAGEHAATALTADATLEKISGVTTNISGATYDIEGLAGTCLRFDGQNDYVECNTAGPNYTTNGSDPTSSCTTEMSVVAHIVPDNASDNRYIIAQHVYSGESISHDKFYLRLNSSNQIEARVAFDTGTNDGVLLTSSSIIPADGEFPTNIILTADTTLKSGNVKLFINGKLEDQTGLRTTAGSTNNWKTGQSINGGNGTVRIGGHVLYDESSFDGKLEEMVIYKKCIYPVQTTNQKYLFTKPISELVTGVTKAQSKSNTARLFIKDYHNFRGTTPQEVCTSSQVSWRKAAFALDTS